MKLITNVLLISSFALFSIGTLAQDISSLSSIEGPAIVRIADVAEMKLSDNLNYYNESETQKFLQLTNNLPQPGSNIISNNEERWFGVFTFIREGYVKDTEKIDADELLEILKKKDEKINVQRAKQGLPELRLVGWYIPPRYNEQFKSLEWATKFTSNEYGDTVNFTRSILGRSGHMTIVLVADPADIDNAMDSFDIALRDFEYVSGERYDEFKMGDKTAAYGLGALITGGAVAVASSKGGFKFLWALLVAAFTGVVAYFKRILGIKK
jgi:uncharacterized membrane-anchored protein